MNLGAAHRAKGRFTLGDIVDWTGKHGYPHRGEVTHVVPHGVYPMDVLKGDLRGMRYRGWWRYGESYVVQDAKGKRWWPRTSALNLVQELNDAD